MADITIDPTEPSDSIDLGDRADPTQTTEAGARAGAGAGAEPDLDRRSSRGAFLVAGITFRELLRRPGGWVATLLTGLLFALLVGTVGLAGERAQDRVESRSFRVAVGGDLEGAKLVREKLATPRLVLVESSNVADEVTNSRASSGIIFPEGTDRRLAAGEEIEVQLFVRSSQNLSTESFTNIGVRLQEIELAQMTGGKDRDIATFDGLQIDVIEVPRDATINRIQLARQLAPIAALLCIGVVTSVASVFGAARERRSIEPLLVLPLARESITLGISLGAYPLACLQVLGAVGLLVMTAAIPTSSGQQSVATVIAMLAAGGFASLLLALVATAFGCLAGSLGTGSDEAVSLGDLVAILFVVAGVLVFMAPTVGDSPAYDAVPVLGQVLIMRDLVSGVVNPLGIALSTASAVAVFVAIVRFAGRRLSDEKRLARAIR